ncbi:enoyl-CoA hydratase family protein [Gordonia sp. SID5947]|uniref:enoyl-CoA hydratase family protein n=1 Tax=Gordonia sp. SID5947 TaxID=2690315 RepID=UPI0013713087|nr:enoyl-CoA hydratase family protein [Gordonia sp. SID5947]MYR08686.1 enoyl-CoA hydratase family protein [Gordonia sp. SID5947]
MTEVVHSDLVDEVLTLTLDSPANRNALGEALVAQLLDGLRAAERDPGIRAVMLTHTGGTFCAGADLSEALARGADVAEASAMGTSAMIDLMRVILEMPKPVIAKVDGHVRAGGFGLLGAADIALAGPRCTFALTEARLGLAPSVISLVLLPKMTARSSGRYFLTGETFDPSTAVRNGLVTEAFASADDLDAGVASVLAGIRRASPQGLAASKMLATAAVLSGFRGLAGQRADESAALFASEEAREGMTAFLSKRAPRWDLSVSAD